MYTENHKRDESAVMSTPKVKSRFFRDRLLAIEADLDAAVDTYNGMPSDECLTISIENAPFVEVGSIDPALDEDARWSCEGYDLVYMTGEATGLSEDTE